MKCEICIHKKGESLGQDEGGYGYHVYCDKGHWEGDGGDPEGVVQEHDPFATCSDFSDRREWPCSECEEGEMKPVGGVSPSGTVTYECTQCGHTERYPQYGYSGSS